MAGSWATPVRENVSFGKATKDRFVEIVSIEWTGDASDGSVPSLTGLVLQGFITRVSTNPGTPAPTDNWDFTITDEEQGSVVVTGTDRDTTTSENLAPIITSGVTPIPVAKKHTVAVSGNSVNGAKGKIYIWLSE